MRDDDTPRSFRDELGEQVINIYVGSKPEKFCVHRRLLCQKSPYFEKALNGSREVFAGVYRYQMEADTDAFTQLIEWLYKGTIAAPSLEPSETRAYAYINNLIDLYILAEELEIKGLADDVVEYIGSSYSYSGSLPSKEEIDVVFRVTRGASTLRRYMAAAFHFTLVACCHSEINGVSAPTTDELWKLAKDHEELGKDVFKALRKDALEPQDPRTALICNYHNHDNETPCNARGKRFSGKMEVDLNNTVVINNVNPASLFLPAPNIKLPVGPDAYKALSNLPVQLQSSEDSRKAQRESSGSSQTIIATSEWQNRINDLAERRSPSLNNRISENLRAGSDHDGREVSNTNVLGPYPVSNKRDRPSSDRREEDIPAGKRNRGGGRSTR